MTRTIVFEESEHRKFSLLSLSPSLAKVCASVFACRPICLKRHETKYFCSLFASIMVHLMPNLVQTSTAKGQSLKACSEVSEN
ncbi:hypothetical protein Gogos_009043 [Gossypium gossypioides]|uniref:Uncharacterized protein n=1 Tax=Gossypium gossypioides TaxID=34282 RepID=A0A7J9CEF7_GOSGO|nr:hypothetical protein [Gossypium gossypioides]